MTDTPTLVAETLDCAAAQLLEVGWADPFATSPGVRLHCLWAVELLRTAGANPPRPPVGLTAREARPRIRLALATLAALPPDVAAQASVLDAAAAARAALDALNGLD